MKSILFICKLLFFLIISFFILYKIYEYLYVTPELQILKNILDNLPFILYGFDSNGNINYRNLLASQHLPINNVEDIKKLFKDYNFDQSLLNQHKFEINLQNKNLSVFYKKSLYLIFKTITKTLNEEYFFEYINNLSYGLEIYDKSHQLLIKNNQIDYLKYNDLIDRNYRYFSQQYNTSNLVINKIYPKPLEDNILKNFFLPVCVLNNNLEIIDSNLEFNNIFNYSSHFIDLLVIQDKEIFINFLRKSFNYNFTFNNNKIYKLNILHQNNFLFIFFYEHHLFYLEDIIKKQRMHLLGETSVKIAHDIKNILFVLNNNLEEIPKSENLLGLTKQIELLCKYIISFKEQGEAKKKKINMNEYVKNFVFLVEDTIHNKNIKLEYILYHKDIFVYIEEISLWQILINLYINSTQAIKDEGFIKIIVNEEENLENIKYLTVEIIDNGPGITKDIKSQLFHTRVSTKDNNLGIGLMHINEIVKNYNGFINVFSEDNYTSFKVYLPQI